MKRNKSDFKYGNVTNGMELRVIKRYLGDIFKDFILIVLQPKTLFLFMPFLSHCLIFSYLNFWEAESRIH